jgi:hypothetical protein
MEYVIYWLLFGMVAAIIANSKGRSGCGWFLLGMLLGPFSLVVVALSSKKVGQEVPSPKTHLVCPDCAELVKKEARICKHCGCRLAPQEEVQHSYPPAKDDSARNTMAYKAGRLRAKMKMK